VEWIHVVCYDADIDYSAWNGWMRKEGVRYKKVKEAKMKGGLLMRRCLS